MTDTITKLTQTLNKQIEWVKENATLSKALNAPQGAVIHRQSVIKVLHQIKTVIRSLTTKTKIITHNDMDITQIESATLKQLRTYEAKLIDSRFNAARVFHSASTDQHTALQGVEDYLRYVSDLIRKQEAQRSSTPDPPSPMTALFNAPSTHSSTGTRDVIEYTDDTYDSQKSVIPPGSFPLKREIDFTPISRNDHQNSSDRNIRKETQVDETTEPRSGESVIQVIQETKTELIQTQKENRLLRSKLIKQKQVLKVRSKGQLAQYKTEISQISRQNRILENQIQSLQTQLKHVESLYRQSRSNQQPNIQPIVSENQRLIAQLAQAQQRQVDDQYIQLMNELKEIRSQLASVQEDNPTQ